MKGHKEVLEDFIRSTCGCKLRPRDSPCSSFFTKLTIEKCRADNLELSRDELDSVPDPGGKGDANEPPPFGLHLTRRSTDDRLNRPPPLSGYRTKKTAVMAHLRML